METQQRRPGTTPLHGRPLDEDGGMELRVRRKLPDVMIDLETLGSGAQAVVLSIGAVCFHPDVPRLSVEEQLFYRVLDQEDQRARGREVDEATVRWWAEQSAEAQAVLSAPYETVGNVLRDLRILVEDYTTGELEVRVWGNGSDFDLSILNSLHRTYGATPPWRFYNHRCFRTIKTWFPREYAAAQVVVPRVGAHDAQADALYQTRVLQFIHRAAPR